MKNCLRCTKELDSNRKKFCNSFCKNWYNSVKKDKEAHLPPAKKRNRNFFSMITGYGNASKEQGKRAGHMVTGAMSAGVNCTIEQWAEVTPENLKAHFTCISFWTPIGIRLGDGTFIKREEISKELGISFE